MNKNINLNDKNMHGDDKRNLIIFFVSCLGLFLLYDTFIHKPHLEKLKAAQEQALIMPKTPETPKITALTREDVIKQSNRLKIESDTLVGSLNLTGGRIDDLSLKNYMAEAGGKTIVTLLNPAQSQDGYYGEFGWLSSDASIPMPSSSTRWTADKSIMKPNDPVTLKWNNGRGLTFTKIITLDSKYMFSIEQSVKNNTGKSVTLYPFAAIGRDGVPKDRTGAFILHEGPIGYVGDELVEVDYADLDDGETTTQKASKGWIGITDKYWLTALMMGKDYNQDTKFRLIGETKENANTHYQSDIMGSAITVESGQNITVPVNYFAGPKIVSMLEDYSAQYNIPHFDLAVDFGVLYFLTRPFYEVLTFLNNVFGNFAIALLVFTVIIKLCVFPLAQKSYRSFARMSKVTPQMVELREKFGSDRVKLQQAIFELYKRENVNPMAGCLPLLLQIPIFFALYKVFYVNIGMRHEPFWGWISDMSHADPSNLFEAFGLIQWDAPSWLHIGAWPIIMGCTLAIQQRLSPPPQDETQKMVMKIMPFWLVFIMAKFPAGLIIYWSWSNTLSILQQYLLLRQEGVHVNIFTRERVVKNEAKQFKPNENTAKTIISEIAGDIDHDDIEPVTKTISPKKRKKKK